MKKFGYFLKSLLPFIIFELLQYGVTFGLMIGLGVLHFMQSSDGSSVYEYISSLTADTNFTQLVSVVFAVIIIFVFGIWYRRVFVRPMKGRQRKYWTGISFQTLVSLIFLAFGLQYLAQLVTGIVSELRPDWMSTYEAILESAGYSSVTILLLAYALILAPIGEELTFRGLTYRFARRALPFWTANILQALLFGIMHANMIQGIYAFAVGLILGWVCRVGHSIKYSVILHILFNILGTLFYSFFTMTEAISETAAYGIGILLLIFGMLIYRWEHGRKNRKRSRTGRKRRRQN